MKNQVLITWALVVGALIYVLAPLSQSDRRNGFEMQKFGRVPVLLNGRIKPLDTVARNSLLIIHGKQSLATENGTLTPMDWLAEVMMTPDTANLRKVFVIRNSETLDAIGLKADAGKYFSFREFVPHLEEIQQQAQLADKVDAALRSPFQRDITKLFERITLFHRLENTLEVAGTTNLKGWLDDLVKNTHPAPVPMDTGITPDALQSIGFLSETGYFFPVPPFPANDDPLQWRKMGDSLLGFLTSGQLHPAVGEWATMATAFAANDPKTFNQTLDHYSATILQRDGALCSHLYPRLRLMAYLAGIIGADCPLAPSRNLCHS
jgi:hypothetical protein